MHVYRVFAIRPYYSIVLILSAAHSQYLPVQCRVPVTNRVTFRPPRLICCTIRSRYGVAAAYFSWRHMHYVLFAAATLAFMIIFLALPETIHPGTRGVDKAPESDKNKFVWLNPLSSLWLLRSPNLLAVVSEVCSSLRQ